MFVKGDDLRAGAVFADGVGIAPNGRTPDVDLKRLALAVDDEVGGGRVELLHFVKPWE